MVKHIWILKLQYYYELYPNDRAAWVTKKPAHSNVYMMTLQKNKVTHYLSIHKKLDIYFLN